MPGRIGCNRDRFDDALFELLDSFASSRVGLKDVPLQTPDDVRPIALTPQSTSAVHEGRVEKLTQRGEGTIVAVVGRGGEQQQRVAAAGQYLGQTTTL